MLRVSCVSSNNSSCNPRLVPTPRFERACFPLCDNTDYVSIISSVRLNEDDEDQFTTTLRTINENNNTNFTAIDLKKKKKKREEDYRNLITIYLIKI